jgi:hypothetical protein
LGGKERIEAQGIKVLSIVNFEKVHELWEWKVLILFICWYSFLEGDLELELVKFAIVFYDPL